MRSVSPLFSARPGKRAVEQTWLMYTPVWGVITGVIMLGGFARSWSDPALMTFGASIALGTLVLPMLTMPPEERALPWSSRVSTAMTAVIVVLAFGMNVFQTPFFFDVLHMHYGFHARWAFDRNPLFLYLVTVPYFATYSVLACMAFRFVRGLPLPPVVSVICIAIVPFAIAFLETLLNANPFMRSLFCYDDTLFALTFGTLAYGISFVLALPLWLRVGESARPVALSAIVMSVMLVVALDTAALFVVRHTVAPLVTTVHDDAPPGGGCLSD
jgi:hypothetical protein